MVTYSFLNEVFEHRAREAIKAEGAQFRFERMENPQVVVSKDLPPDYDKVVGNGEEQA